MALVPHILASVKPGQQEWTLLRRRPANFRFRTHQRNSLNTYLSVKKKKSFGRNCREKQHTLYPHTLDRYENLTLFDILNESERTRQDSRVSYHHKSSFLKQFPPTWRFGCGVSYKISHQLVNPGKSAKPTWKWLLTASNEHRPTIPRAQNAEASTAENQSTTRTDSSNS